MYKMEPCSVSYFHVEETYDIKGEGRYYCSCNEDICWHILKIILEINYIEFQPNIKLNAGI